MGQKVNPVGFRLGVTKSWSSRWYADKKSYASNIMEDIRIRDYIKNKFEVAGVSSVEIERASKNLLVNITASRPGIIIGKKGADAEKLKSEIKKICKITSGSPSLNIKDVKKADLEALLVANNVKQQLERRVSFRRAMKKTMGSVMKAGALGVKIQCAGRLAGADMARTERYNEGRVPLHTIRADVDYALAEALTGYGIIGIKVWIFRGEVFDKVQTK